MSDALEKAQVESIVRAILRDLVGDTAADADAKASFETLEVDDLDLVDLELFLEEEIPGLRFCAETAFSAVSDHTGVPFTIATVVDHVLAVHRKVD